MQYIKDDKYFQIPDYKLRILQMIKVYLLSPVSGMSTCPLSMTDGAIYLLKYIQGTNPEYFNDLMKESLISLLSGNCDKFFYSGQWMTEILGGSDVRNSTKTVAIYNEKYSEKKSLKYNLYGLKWFTSAIDADISFTLAKIYDPITNKVDDLPTLFFVKVKTIILALIN